MTQVRTSWTKLDWRPLEHTDCEITGPRLAPGGYAWRVRHKAGGAGAAGVATSAAQALIEATIAAGQVGEVVALLSRSRPAVDATPEGLQLVIPGCEKDQDRGPAQLSFL